MENFDKLFDSCKNKRMPLNERKFTITDIKTPAGKKIYTILNDAKINIKDEIEKLFKKSDENRGVISNTVLEEMPNFIELVARLERTPTFKSSFDVAEEPDMDLGMDDDPDSEYQDSMEDNPDGDDDDVDLDAEVDTDDDEDNED